MEDCSEFKWIKALEARRKTLLQVVKLSFTGSCCDPTRTIFLLSQHTDVLLVPTRTPKVGVMLGTLCV